MTEPDAVGPFGGIDVVATSVGGGCVSGMLSLLDPALAALTATLALLAIVGWIDRVRRLAGAHRQRTWQRTRGPLALLAAIAVLCVTAPPAGLPWKGVALGLALVPFGWASWRARVGGEG